MSDDGLFPRATGAALQNRSVVVRMVKAHASVAFGSGFHETEMRDRYVVVVIRARLLLLRDELWYDVRAQFRSGGRDAPRRIPCSAPRSRRVLRLRSRLRLCLHSRLRLCSRLRRALFSHLRLRSRLRSRLRRSRDVKVLRPIILDIRQGPRELVR